MKKNRLYIYGGILILAVLSVFAYYKKNIEESFLEKEISKINIDSLSKYYQIFKISKEEDDYDKADFLNFIKDKNLVLKEQLSNDKIRLNSQLKAESNNGFEGFYHIGLDNVDDNASLIKLKSSSTLAGDLLIPSKNYYDLRPNRIYVLNKGDIKDLGEFNAYRILAKSLNCDNKVKMKLDTIEDNIGVLKFINGKTHTNSEIESRTLNAFLNDSILLSVIKQYDIVYLSFNYKPLDYFYCSDEINE